LALIYVYGDSFIEDKMEASQSAASLLVTSKLVYLHQRHGHGRHFCCQSTTASTSILLRLSLTVIYLKKNSDSVDLLLLCNAATSYHSALPQLCIVLGLLCEGRDW